MWNERLGFLGTCPSNLGTGLRASVMIFLPEFNKLMESHDSEDRELLDKVCSAYDLQPRGSTGEHSAAVVSTYLGNHATLKEINSIFLSFLLLSFTVYWKLI